MVALIVVVIVAALSYLCADKNKFGSALGMGLIVGIPLGALVDGLVAGELHTWMFFLVAIAFYAGISMNK